MPGGKRQEQPPRPSGWPGPITPMLAELAAAPFDSPEHLFEIKWDGIRCLVRIEPDLLTLHNRKLVEMSARYPELAGLASLPPYSILDGEVVVLDEGRPSFTKV